MEVKDPSWVKEQLEFLPNLITGVHRKSIETQMGYSPQENVPISDMDDEKIDVNKMYKDYFND